MSTDARDVIAAQLHRLLCLDTWERCNTHGIHWHDAGIIAVALAEAGLLLPPGGETEHEYAIQMPNGNVLGGFFDRQACEDQIQLRKQWGRPQPGILISRTVYTGPWQPTDVSGEDR